MNSANVHHRSKVRRKRLSADISAPLTEEENRSGIHGVDISKAKSNTAPFALPVCYICHFTEDGKIDRVREYWDVATMTRQFGIENIKAKIIRFFMRRVSAGWAT